MKLYGWCDKPPHGQYPSRSYKKGVSCWLKTGYFKKETESLLMTAQDQTIATKAFRATILKQQLILIIIYKFIYLMNIISINFFEEQQGRNVCLSDKCLSLVYPLLLQATGDCK